ncbi:putative structural protein [Staphylococcus phage S25-3]|uniref:Structural protein n=2 Tax=Kayvirus TaxID=1857843 RepID=V5XVY7_BPS25|nr:virion structural protein [Staphylococcus phage S25-4]YP_008854245.1 virion structural protein [Staphylococcus phage S25-3]BAO09273.1 putative structural protein [Staphylococcus phage S25-3]BAO09488.1 putative structural protein [Staphylococcus phage S25-4]
MANFLKNLHPLLRRDRNKKDNQDPNFALIDALNEEMNQVEKDAIESKLQSSLKTSTSEYLDKFGDWFGVYRKTDENDDVYRARIIKYLLLKRGTNNAIIDAIKDYLGRDDIDVSVYEPFTNIFYTNKSHLNGEDHLMGYYYRFAVINVSIGDYFPVEIIDVINEFKPAGVTLYVTYDGASTIRGGAIIKWLEGLPKIETYQEFDRFTGYDDTFYGHINMNQSKDTDNSSSDIFKTNHSLINSLDVLTGSSSVGRQYINYGYVTSYVYNPGMTSSVNQISASTEGRGQEVPTDYYMYTSTKNNNTVELSMQTTSGVSYLYNNFNFRDYMSKYRPQVDLQSDEARRIVSDYIKELSIDYYLSAVIPPDESIEIKLQVYDFSINRWLTVSISNLSFYEKNIGSNIGYIKDYLNNELNMFTRLEINAGKRDSVDIKVNYLDLMFYYYERGIYTIKPYKALVENYLDISRETYVEAFKIASLLNGDIITKTGFQPIGYLKVSGDIPNFNSHVSVSTLDTNNIYMTRTVIKEQTGSLILSYGNIKTNISSFNISSDTPISNIKLEYSYYGDNWVELTRLDRIPKGITPISNNLIDVYGLQTVDYSNINPMSKVSLRSIWNVKLGELNNQEGFLSNMPNDYFNAVWQDIDKLSDIDLSSMRMVKDTEGGVFDGATGEIIKATLFNIGAYTDLDMLAYTLTNYTEPLTLGSSRLISELKEELLTSESFNVDNRIKVIDSISDVTTDKNLIINYNKETTLSNYASIKMNLLAPIEEGSTYELTIEGDFKDNLSIILLTNDRASFRETELYKSHIVSGVARKQFVAKNETENNIRGNKYAMLYIQPYDSGLNIIRKVVLRKV